MDESVVLDNSVECIGGNSISVKVVRHNELSKILNNPFRQPSEYFCFRLDLSNRHELISKYPLSVYSVRYLKMPEPIILSNLSGN